MSSSLVGGGGSMMSHSKSKSKSETVNYLLLYEAMVRHQDLEYDATYDHIALTMGRIQYLGRPQQQQSSQPQQSQLHPPTTPKLVAEDNSDEDAVPKGMLTYLQMRRCLLRLGYTWNRSLLPPPPSQSSNNSFSLDQYYYDDDVSVMSTNSASTFLSANNNSTSGATASTTRDIIATDAQLIMLLTTLVEMEEKDRARKLLRLMKTKKSSETLKGKKQQMKTNNGNKQEEEEEDDEDEYQVMFAKGLFLPEFVQAYKLIIGGMQSLQTYPNPPTTSSHDEYNQYLKACTSLGISPGDEETLQELRLRSRERTLGLLRLFGPNSKNMLSNMEQDTDVDTATNSTRTCTMQSAGESPTAQSSSARRNNNNSKSFFENDGLQHTPNRSSSKKNRYGSSNTPAMTAKDGLLPRLTEEEIRKMVHSKDTALARILEDHESEMNVMATNMEELRQRSMATARMIKKRRKRTRLVVGICVLFSIVGGVMYELHRREQVKVEIMTGREAERQADLATIASLKENVALLKSKLNDAEATIRYEEGRYEEVKDKYQKVTRTLEETEGRWLFDRRDLDHCRVTRKELDRELSDVKSRNVAVEEEVGWCRERLQGTERALEAMERALKSKESGGQSISGDSGNDKGLVATTISGEDDSNKTDKKKQKGIKHKPVQMEMKYNKSFRNAVILRQVYSAAVGMFVSALFPGIGKVISFLISM